MKGHNWGLCKKCGKTHKHRIWNIGKTKDNNESIKRTSEANIGHIPWNKGKIGVYSEETLKIMSENRSKYFEDHPEAKKFGSDNPASRPDVKKKIGDGNRGKIHSKEHNEKISLSSKGKHKEPHPYMLGEKNYFYNKHMFGKENPFFGKKHKPETIEAMKQKLSLMFCGENSPAWRGGYKDYKGSNWKRNARQARERDNYICQDCMKTQSEIGKRLDVHHIIPQRFFETLEESNILKNLISLCHSCHIKRDAKIWKYESNNKNVTLVVLMEAILKF